MKVLCTTEMRVIKVVPDGHFLSWYKRITVMILPHFIEKENTFLRLHILFLQQDRMIQEIWSIQEFSARARIWGCGEKNLVLFQSMENISKIILFRLF